MTTRTFEQAIELKSIDQDVYENAHYPAWNWPGTRVFPGGTLMAQAAAAAYQTVGQDFSLDSLHAHFLSGPDTRLPLRYKVERVNDSGRFAVRAVVARQKDKAMLHVTCSFARSSAMTGPSMTHTVQRQGKQTIEFITLDDLELARNKRGPYMKFQRLPLDYIGSRKAPETPTPDNLLYTSVATISPPISSADMRLHSLGILALSDYHVLDAAPTLHGLTFGHPQINDKTRTRTESNFQFMTSLNHTVHFARQDDFRADDLCYIEVTSPWTNARQAEMQTRIFDREGKLIATCVQGGYYVLKDKAESKI